MSKMKDRVGHQYGKLIVVAYDHSGKFGPMWLCKCQCGNTKIVLGHHLTQGSVKSCGCLKPRVNHQDILTHRFGKLVATKYNKTKYLQSGRREHYYTCKCDCGNTVDVSRTCLLIGSTKSCGCINKNKTGYQEISGSYWGSICRGAAQRHLDFDITLEYIWQLFLTQNRKCVLTGIPLQFIVTNYSQNRKKYQTASLDRIDSSKGYIVGNVQWVHKNVNMMKQHFSQKDFIELCIKVVSHVKIDS